MMMEDPLQFATIEEPLQMGLEECLFLMHRHRQHLETYRDYFARLKDHLNLHVLSTCRRLRLPRSEHCHCDEDYDDDDDEKEKEEEKREIEQQLNLIGQQHDRAMQLQHQLKNHVSAIVELCNYLSASLR